MVRAVLQILACAALAWSNGEGWGPAAPGEHRAWARLAGGVDSSCSFRLRVGVGSTLDPRRLGPALSLRFGASRDEYFVAEPHAANSSRFATRPALCTFDDAALRDDARARPAVLMVANNLDYLFRLWPYFVNKVLWASSVGLPVAVWIGELPPLLASSVTDECSRSRQRRAFVSAAPDHRLLKQSFYSGIKANNSNHHIKMLAAYALINRPRISGAYFIDMDAYVETPAFANLSVAPLFLAVDVDHDVDVLFENSRNPNVFWHVHGSMFYVRDSVGARVFLSEWLHWRCGFKDQYSLWHAILSLSAHAGCLEYHDEIFDMTYQEALKVNKTLANHSNLAMSCEQRRRRCPSFRFCNSDYDLSRQIFVHKGINSKNARDVPYADEAGAKHTFAIQDMMLNTAPNTLFDLLNLEPAERQRQTLPPLRWA